MKNPSICVNAEVAFHDVDSLRIVWHGHYYKYFELARTALYRSKNFDIQVMTELGLIFPVIESQCRYFKPLHYGQKFQVTATFKDWHHYIKIVYVIVDAETQEKCASGFTKQAACLVDGEMLLAMPEHVIDVIQA